MAFVPSTTFTGRSVQSCNDFHTPLCVQTKVKNANVVQMTYYAPVDVMGNLLGKYNKLATAKTKLAEPSKTSSVWKSYISYITKNDVLPNYITDNWLDNFQIYMYGISSRARKSYPPGGAPKVTFADTYMSKCITSQYKQMACSNGVYSVSCTEGTIKHQADQSRVMALGKEFKSKQRSTISQYNLFFESRKKTNIMAHECSYEQELYGKLPKSRSIGVQAYAEAMGACARPVTSGDKAEQYMMSSVDKQCKQISCSTGVYTVECFDGSVKDMAEDKRVIGLAAKFREKQLPKIVQMQRQYNRKKYARDFYAHGCDYEETLFNKYPGMAASMSSFGSNY